MGEGHRFTSEGATDAVDQALIEKHVLKALELPRAQCHIDQSGVGFTLSVRFLLLQRQERHRDDSHIVPLRIGLFGDVLTGLFEDRHDRIIRHTDAVDESGRAAILQDGLSPEKRNHRTGAHQRVDHRGLGRNRFQSSGAQIRRQWHHSHSVSASLGLSIRLERLLVATATRGWLFMFQRSPNTVVKVELTKVSGVKALHEHLLQ